MTPRSTLPADAGLTDPGVRGWFDANTWQRPSRSVRELRASAGGRRISVVLPALDEESTVGALVAGVLPLTRGDDALVHELVVMDSGSTDRTREVAARAGARVVAREDVLPGHVVRPGKGEVLWRSLAATTGDVIVFLDADLIGVDPAVLVPALVEPLLVRPEIRLAKGFHRRPLAADPTGGGRVTELLVRPLLAALHPGLSGVVQPLGGEYAATRGLLESLPFAPGYGVEIGLLLDTVARHGLPALAQVNLGVRRHRNRPVPDLGVMSREILGTVLRRTPGTVDAGGRLVQFEQVGDDAGAWLPVERPVETRERPPLVALLIP